MVINFFGRRGSGKTTTIKGQLLDCRPPVFVVDVLGNFHNENYFETTNLGDAIRASNRFNKLVREKKAGHRGSGFSARYYSAPEKIIVLKTADPSTAADYISATIWELNGGTLILDEVDAIDMSKGSCFDQYIRYGRNHKGDLITGCRRPAELHKNITAAANKLYCFGTHEPRDIDYFYEIFGENAEKLYSLPAYHGLFIDYEAKSTGIFCIDREGHIYHAKENQF